MVVVRIELWPGGRVSEKRELGSAMMIANSGDHEAGARFGNYDVFLLKRASRVSKSAPVERAIWRKGRVEDFPRQRLGEWDLLLRALLSIVGERNLSTQEQADADQALDAGAAIEVTTESAEPRWDEV